MFRLRRHFQPKKIFCKYYDIVKIFLKYYIVNIYENINFLKYLQLEYYCKEHFGYTILLIQKHEQNDYS